MPSHSVKEKEDTHTNPWGLVDMHGNVWEWCGDNWTSTVSELPKDGSPYLNGSQDRKALRGGAWFNHSCASGRRGHNFAHYAGNDGFRVVCV